jgi:hypothetical protein
MKAIFGPNTPQILEFLTNLRNVSAPQVDQVVRRWKRASDLDRAAAWARLQSARSQREKYAFMGVAYAARQAAMDAARTLDRNDWAFWAAAWDAGAAVTADRLSDSDYELLTGPIAAIMPCLRRGNLNHDVTVPAQARRPATRRHSRHDSYT